MADANAVYQGLIKDVKEIAMLRSSATVLGWDERTQMPPKGGAHRAEQLALLARVAHERFIDPKIGKRLEELSGSELMQRSDSDEATNIRELKRRYERDVKLPSKFVEELRRIEVLGQQAWVEARKKADFQQFLPWLEKIVKLKQQEAELYGYEGSPYNALLEDYEPGERVDDLNRVFAELRQPLVELIARIKDAPRQAPVEILERHYPANQQEKLAREAAQRVGFDFSAGRLDVSVHPFCCDIGPGDVRMTTRYDEKYFGDAFFGVLHETGHGLYDQGFRPEHWGTPCGGSISLGIHESQSRMWENFVGRGRAFWRFFFPKAREAFAEALKDVTLDQWYFAVNDVRPSFIRTESDEATYNLHILLRFELEQALLTGALAAKDLPGAWNEKMQKYLGLTPPDDAKGCLQDIHWSGGSIGYFPTYTLGNLYAAHFFEQARADLGDLDAKFAAGDFSPLLGWLREKIHGTGRRYTARALLKRVTNSELSAQPLLRHLRAKAAELYKV